MKRKEEHKLKELLNRDQPFINYEEKLISLGDNQASTNTGSIHSLGKESNWCKQECYRINRNRIDRYIPLNTSREKTLKECARTQFKKAWINNPFPIRESSQTDKSNYQCFNKSHCQNTNECIQLKDVIEGLTRKVVCPSTLNMGKGTMMFPRRESSPRPRELMSSSEVRKQLAKKIRGILGNTCTLHRVTPWFNYSLI